MPGVPWEAVQRLGRFAGLQYKGDRIYKSEAEDDFSALPTEVQDALVVVGRLVDDPAPVVKAEFPHTKEDGDKAKAAAVAQAKAATSTAVKERPLKPGEGRQYATEILANLVKQLRQDRPSLSEADAWVSVLETPEGAKWYGIGEQADQESRRK